MVHVIIVAAGKGNRFGGELPKQFLLLNDKPVLMYSLENFREINYKKNIITVISKEMTAFWKKECSARGVDPGKLIEGGSTRWESVRNGILALGSLGPDDLILVHDGARPLVTNKIINDIIDSVQKGHDGAIPVIELYDSIRQIIDNGSSVGIDRSNLRAVQTPQGFNAIKLKTAFDREYDERFTDEATVMQTAGYSDIELVKGDCRNLKITRPIDLKIAELFLQFQ